MFNNHLPFKHLRACRILPLESCVLSLVSSFLYNCRGISTNRPIFLQNEPNFRKSQMNVNKVFTMNYEKKDTWWAGKKRTQTNPKRTQYEPKQTRRRARGGPIFQRPKMSASVYFTTNYENNPAARLRENKPNSNPIFQEAQNEPKLNCYKGLSKSAPPPACGG